MTDKELSKLRRVELLEILVELRKQLDAAKKENEDLRAELEKERCGTAERTEQMVRRLYEERFGPFEDGEAAEDESSEEAALEDKADE
ncbi:MAG: hypothetical protein IJM87_03095 [Ruminococcus sp.]|nr:hypothetical protein [Ruminococcus sp.]